MRHARMLALTTLMLFQVFNAFNAFDARRVREAGKLVTRARDRRRAMP